MHARHLIVFRNGLANILILKKLLGTPVSIGISMLLMAFEWDPWVSARTLAEMADVSDDTARRRLDQLIKINRVEYKVEHGRRLYRLKPEFAQALIGKMRLDHSILTNVPDPPQLAAESRD